MPPMNSKRFTLAELKLVMKNKPDMSGDKRVVDAVANSLVHHMMKARTLRANGSAGDVLPYEPEKDAAIKLAIKTTK